MRHHILFLKSSWGLSDIPGMKWMYFYDDGSYDIYLEYFQEKDRVDNKVASGRITDMTRFEKIKDFLDKNVTENYDQVIFDASFEIQYLGTSRVNDTDLWFEIMNLLPEFRLS